MRIVSKTRLLSPLFLLPKPLISGAAANQEKTLDTIASPQFQFPEPDPSPTLYAKQLSKQRHKC